MAFFVYIMTNKPDGTLYIGYTDDLGRRLMEHREKVREGFAKRYNLTRLVHFEAYDTREKAKQRERRLKRWLRVWKAELIEKENPTWRDLSEDIPLP
ncbi:GIY-YIG nuclease family protein [Pyruvatibacter sp.]|uniref:GIY-YIG nuclease family protein n=1 Tax=Pyruvatibacter sp. TaxID=1981328 RepID=UPI0032ED74DD